MSVRTEATKRSFCIGISVIVLGLAPTLFGSVDASHLVPVEPNFGSSAHETIYARIIESKLFVPNWELRYFSILAHPPASQGISISKRSAGHFQIHLRQARPDVGSVDFKKTLHGVEISKFDEDIPNEMAQALIELWAAMLRGTRTEEPRRDVIYVHPITSILYQKQPGGRVVAGRLPLDAFDHREFRNFVDIINKLGEIAEIPTAQREPQYVKISAMARKLKRRIPG